MSKILAIKGDKERGNEVIALLEMLGGNNVHNLYGEESYAYYVIEGVDNEIRGGIYIFANENLRVFTLDEFYEKYPYKVGDKVQSPSKGCIKTITGIKWNPDMETIVYELDNKIYTNADILNVHNNPKHDMETKVEGMTINFDICTEDEVELQLGNYEIVVRDGKTYAVKKKPKYPKLTNLYECKEILGEKDIYQSVSGYKGELLTNFQRLLIFRNAYWKIAGEQMGLDKPWEPDWKDMYYVITVRDDGDFLLHRRTRALLIFPTEEMRDAFYENFKDLIEMCKELL